MSVLIGYTECKQKQFKNNAAPMKSDQFRVQGIGISAYIGLFLQIIINLMYFF